MRWLGTCMVVFAVGVVSAQQSVRDRQEAARLQVVAVDLRNLDLVLAAYHAKHQEYPKTLKELAEGVQPYLERVPFDPWKKPYQYDPAGKKNGGKKPDVWTVTPDKKTIGNWPAKKPTKES